MLIFCEIGRADELGSGVRNLMKYGKAYGGADPELIEGDVFRIIVKYPDSTVYDRNSTVTEETLPQSVLSVLFLQLLDIAREPTSIEALMELSGQTNRTRFRKAVLRPLLDIGILEMTIPDKPRSSKQKYRITTTGRACLENR